MALISFIAGLALKYMVYDPFILFWEKNPSFLQIALAVWSDRDFKIIFFIFVLIGLIILFIKYKIKRNKKLKEISEEQNRIDNQAYEIKKWTDESIEYFSSDKLKEFIKRIDKDYLYKENKEEFGIEIKKKLIEANSHLKKALHDEELGRYSNKKEELRNEIQKLRNERFNEELKSQNKKEIILKRLNADESLIYESGKLTKEEIDILKEADFEETTEYDPITQKRKRFVIKKILKHSATHTFLVARIGEFLENKKEVKSVYYHETKDADITFEIGRTIYAFEVEAGSLLRKKDQAKQKASSLNEKYGKNWWFIVTHRDLAKKYREYGKVITRIQVCKIIEKITKK